MLSEDDVTRGKKTVITQNFQLSFGNSLSDLTEIASLLQASFAYLIKHSLYALLFLILYMFIHFVPITILQGRYDYNSPHFTEEQTEVEDSNLVKVTRLASGRVRFKLGPSGSKPVLATSR